MSHLSLKLVVTITLWTTAVAARRLSDKNEEGDSLVLVHVLFRHGDRTVQSETDNFYRTDPHKDFTYYPFGKGQLTNKGKLTEYRTGSELRGRYGRFLGDDYTPELIEVRSSDYNRTKMSLQLVLAALFPPAELWEPSLPWQPIPYNYAPHGKDPLLFPLSCPNFPRYISEYEQSGEYKAILEKHGPLLAHLTAHSGVKYTSLEQLYFMFTILDTQVEWGFTLPEWLKEIYPQPLTAAGLNYYHELTATPDLKKLLSGSLLEKIILDTTAKIHKEKASENRKLYLYSGHEYNIASLLSTLGVFTPHMPPYGSFVAIEVHKIDNVYGVKMYYQNHAQIEPLLLNLPACGTFCPFEKFIRITEQYFPLPHQCGCTDC